MKSKIFKISIILLILLLLIGIFLSFILNPIKKPNTPQDADDVAYDLWLPEHFKYETGTNIYGGATLKGLSDLGISIIDSLETVKVSLPSVSTSGLPVTVLGAKAAQPKDSIFYSCGNNVTAVEFPSTVIEIYDYAFAWNFMGDVDIDITFPKSLVDISSGSFMGCSAIKTITFEEGTQLQYIRNNAFNNCTGLEKIILPENVDIEYGCFDYCTSLVSIEIPASTIFDTRLGHIISHHGFFEKCTSLESIVVANKEKYEEYTTDGHLMNYHKDLLTYPITITYKAYGFKIRTDTKLFQRDTSWEKVGDMWTKTDNYKLPTTRRAWIGSDCFKYASLENVSERLLSGEISNNITLNLEKYKFLWLLILILIILLLLLILVIIRFIRKRLRNKKQKSQ